MNAIVTCRSCGQKNRFKVLSGGKTQRCGACKTNFTEDELNVAAMKSSIADVFGGLGATGVRWDDGTGFDFKDVK